MLYYSSTTWEELVAMSSETCGTIDCPLHGISQLEGDCKATIELCRVCDNGIYMESVSLYCGGCFRYTGQRLKCPNSMNHRDESVE